MRASPEPPQFYFGNFHFEERLASATHSPSARDQDLSRALSTAWLTVAQPGDAIWSPMGQHPVWSFGPPPPNYETVLWLDGTASSSRRYRIVPWGFDSAILGTVPVEAMPTAWPTPASVGRANSRACSAELELELGCGLPRARPIISVEAADDACRLETDGWVIKANFGMSGRERILGRGPLTPAQAGWIRKRLKQPTQRAVFFEPWVARLAEVGIQWHLPTEGEPTLLGSPDLVSTAAGEYRGSLIGHRTAMRIFGEFLETAPNTIPQGTKSTKWPEPCEIPSHVYECQRVALRQIQAAGYFGPVGIDAMLYQSESGARWRPLQDINARYTMGRLALASERWLEAGEAGWFWHGPPAAWARLQERLEKTGESRETAPRVVCVSPSHFSAEPVPHVWAVLAAKPA